MISGDSLKFSAPGCAENYTLCIRNYELYTR